MQERGGSSQAVELLRISLVSLHSAYPTLLPEDALENKSYGDVLEAVSNAKEVLLTHIEQFEAVEGLLRQLGAGSKSPLAASNAEGASDLKHGEQEQRISCTAPQLSHVPLSLQSLPSPGSLSASASSSLYSTIDPASLPQRGFHPPPSRASSSSSFLGTLGTHLEQVGGDAPTYCPSSRLASSLAALAAAQQQSSSAAYTPNSSSNTAPGLDPGLLRLLSRESKAPTDPSAPSSATPNNRQPLLLQQQSMLSPSGMHQTPAQAAAAVGVSQGSLQLMHKQPRRVHSSLPYHWHNAQQRSAAQASKPAQHMQAPGQVWASMPLPNVPHAAGLSAEGSHDPRSRASSQAMPPLSSGQVMMLPASTHYRPQRHSSFNLTGMQQPGQHSPVISAFTQQQQQQQLLLLSQLARQQQQRQQGAHAQQSSTPQQPQPQQQPVQSSTRPGLAPPGGGSLVQHEPGSPILLSQLEELQQPMSALGLDCNASMAAHTPGAIQDPFAARLPGVAAGLEGEALGSRLHDAAGGSTGISFLASFSGGGPAGYGVAAHGLGAPGVWGPTVVGKKEGNKRSGASRRRKAKMYQSLNAMVQSVLDGDSQADTAASAAAVLASSTAFANPSLLFQQQQLHASQQQLLGAVLTDSAPNAGGSGSSSNDSSAHGLVNSQNSQLAPGEGNTDTPLPAAGGWTMRPSRLPSGSGAHHEPHTAEAHAQGRMSRASCDL